MISFREKAFTTLLEDTRQGFRDLTDKAILEPVDKVTEYIEEVEINKKKPFKKKLWKVRGVVTPIRKLIKHEGEKYNKKK
jgi:hypothetical protein